jgi:hypothetical protein
MKTLSITHVHACRETNVLAERVRYNIVFKGTQSKRFVGFSKLILKERFFILWI